MRSIVLIAAFFVLSTVVSVAQIKVVHKKTSVIDKDGLTIFGNFNPAINGRSFQKDILVTHKGYQYVAFYNGERRVCISRRKLPKGKWNTIEFSDYYFSRNDAHNVVSMGICPNDGTVHVVFDHHVDTLKYKVSVKNLANYPDSIEWNAEQFSPILSEMEKGKPIKITYPKFWQTPDGNLQFNYRVGGSGNGDRMLVDYNGKTGLWENTRQIDSRLGYFTDQLGESSTRCSYPNGYDYCSDGKLHATMVWREDSKGANHDLVYVYSEDQGVTWKNNKGKKLKDIPNVNSPDILAYPIPRVLGLMNDQGQVVDSKGRVHVVMFHATEESILQAGSTPGATRWGPKGSRRYLHYWRNNDGKWTQFEMKIKVGDRPKLFVDEEDNVIMIYGEYIQNSKAIVEKKLIIAIATAKNNWTDWHVAKVVKGPFYNDMLGDAYRWKNEKVLSVFVQDVPNKTSNPSKIKVLDFTLKY